MKPITDPKQTDGLEKLIRQMLQQQPDAVDFSADWLTQHAWKGVPMESMGRISPEDIPRIVSALNASGYSQCFAITTEPLGDLPTCYELSVNELEFRELNRQLGLFRFLLTDKDATWAISCNEWYNVFAGRPQMLEALMGKPIEQARQEYFEFATLLARHPDEPLLKVARYYAAL